MPDPDTEIRPGDVSDFPPAPRGAVHRLVDLARAAFGTELVSVVVHGSLAWGCWGPGSDIDVLLVVERATGLAAFHRGLVPLDVHAPGNGFELSVLSRTAARDSPHPVEYLYHFSRDRLARQDPLRWDLTTTGRDPDLAGHMSVARAVGVCAYGSPAADVLRHVGDDEFLASVGADVLDSCADLPGSGSGDVPVPVYAVLNAARTVAWLADRVLLSKRGGGHWLMDREPGHTALLTAALDEYAHPAGRRVPAADLSDLAREVQDRLTAKP